MTYLGICNVGRGSDIQALQRDQTGGYQGQEARGWAQGRTGFGRSEPRARLCGSRLVDVVQPAAILDAVETPDDPPPPSLRDLQERKTDRPPLTRGAWFTSSLGWGPAGRGADPGLLEWTPSPGPVFLPTCLSTLVLLAGWATLQMKVWDPEVLAGTVTMLLRE